MVTAYQAPLEPVIIKVFPTLNWRFEPLHPGSDSSFASLEITLPVRYPGSIPSVDAKAVAETDRTITVHRIKAIENLILLIVIYLH